MINFKKNNPKDFKKCCGKIYLKCNCKSKIDLSYKAYTNKDYLINEIWAKMLKSNPLETREEHKKQLKKLTNNMLLDILSALNKRNK